MANAITKKDSAVTELLHFTLFSGRLCTEINNMEDTKCSEKNFR